MPEPATRPVGAFTVHVPDPTSLPRSDTLVDPIELDLLPPAFGEYADVTPVASGGMGVVYRARNTRLGRVEALKVVRPADGDDDSARVRFEFEAEATAALNHPHAVRVFGSGVIGGRPYFAMQWLDGGDLTAKQPQLARQPQAVARLLAKVARAVHHAHQYGLLHRDLKPSNVLLDAAGEPHVSDFGLAKWIDRDLGVTRLGTMIGTPQYMPPEQACGDVLTTAADVYGLGGILYFLLTGRPPFGGTSVREMFNSIVMLPPVPPGQVNPTADRDLEAICLKCLEKDPQDRYQSAAELADDLERFARGEPVTARTPGLAEWACREVRKQPPPFAGYVWQAKLWFALFIFVSQAVTAAAAWADGPAWWVLAASALTWTGVTAAVWYYKAARFTRLPVVEQHAVMISFGLIAAQAALTFAYLPGRPTAAAMLDVYPATFAVTAVGLVALGATHWGVFYLMGLAALLGVPLTMAEPRLGPWLFGTGMPAAMIYWAVKIRTTFGREPSR